MEIDTRTPDEKNAIAFARLNRKQKRAFRRAIHAEFRKTTRFWRRSWRGVIPQWQATLFAIEGQRHQAARQAEYDAIDRAYGVGV